MALFGFGKKKDEEKNIPACACQSDCATFEATEEDANKVKIEDGAMSVKVAMNNTNRQRRRLKAWDLM